MFVLGCADETVTAAEADGSDGAGTETGGDDDTGSEPEPWALECPEATHEFSPLPEGFSMVEVAPCGEVLGFTYSLRDASWMSGIFHLDGELEGVSSASIWTDYSPSPIGDRFVYKEQQLFRLRRFDGTEERALEVGGTPRWVRSAVSVDRAWFVTCESNEVWAHDSESS